MDSVNAQRGTHRQRLMLMVLLLAGLLALTPGDAWAMRCGTKIITKGDIQAKVLRFCGEPVQTTQRISYRGGIYGDYRVPRTVSVAPDSNNSGTTTNRRSYRNYRYGSTEIVIEEWIYNLGPNKLMRKVTFENGVVDKVETLERGFRE